jgi:heat shock protein HtpX
MTLYDEIGRNNKVTILLFVIYAILYALVVYFALYIFLESDPGLPVFTISTLILLALFYLVAFTQGANIVLALAGARPLEKNEFPFVYNTVEGLSIAAGIQMPKIYIIDSDALNAFATGMEPKKSYIALTTGIIKRMNRAELEGVIAHEMSHIKNYDIRLMLAGAVLAMAIAFIADVTLRSLRSSRGGGKKGSGYIILIGLVFIVLAPIVSTIVRLAISRNREYAADASAAMLTRYPPGLASALTVIKNDYEKNPKELSTNEALKPLFIFEPGKAIISLLSTHPPVEERIARLKKM